MPYAKLDDPQTLNLYNYVRDNPMIGIDVDGHTLQDDMNNKFDKDHDTHWGPDAQARSIAQQQQYLRNLVSPLCLSPRADNTPGDNGSAREIDYNIVSAQTGALYTAGQHDSGGVPLYPNELQDNDSLGGLKQLTEGPNKGKWTSASYTKNEFDDTIKGSSLGQVVKSTQSFIVSGSPGLYPAISAPINVCYGGKTYGSLGLYITPSPNMVVYVNGLTKMPGAPGSSK